MKPPFPSKGKICGDVRYYYQMIQNINDFSSINLYLESIFSFGYFDRIDILLLIISFR